MFTKLLIANRATPALRLIRACRELGIKTVIAYSEADRDSLPTLLADETVCIGPPPARDSYLNISRILSAADVHRCDAIHPGWGFLATNPEFADAVSACGLTVIGPSAETLRLLNDRLMVREVLKKTGVPLLPATEKPITSPSEAVTIATALGMPLIVRPVAEQLPFRHLLTKEKDIENQVRMCQAETRAAQESDPTVPTSAVYLEKFFPAARQVEILLLIDNNGKILTADDWNVSLQYRKRKLVAESPAPFLTVQKRQALKKLATAAARKLKLTGIVTVEFILTRDGTAFLHRIGPQLPLFHPLTETRYGIDLVKTQLQIAAGTSVDHFPQPTADYAITCALYAENPDAEFEPSPGTVTELRLPGGPGIRVDSHLAPGTELPPYYDLLLGTITAAATDTTTASVSSRQQGINRLSRALAETAIGGVTTNLHFIADLIRSPVFHRGEFTADTLNFPNGIP